MWFLVLKFYEGVESGVLGLVVVVWLIKDTPDVPLTGLPAMLHNTYVDACKTARTSSKHSTVYVDDNKLLKLKGKWWIPQRLYDVILWLFWYHHLEEGTHYGFTETSRRLRTNYGFEHLDSIVRLTIRSCHVCQINKIFTVRR